jgi:DNA repair exonuclease SbcCD ATPase subunit
MNIKELLEKLQKGEANIEEVLQAIEDSKKDMVPRSRLNDKIEEIKELQQEITNRDKQIEKLQETIKGNEDFEKKIQSLQAENEKWAQKYQETQLNNAIKLAVAKEAKDANDILYFINKEKLKLKEDGTIEGLEDAIKTLRESKPYLFVQEQPGLKGRKPNDTQTPPPTTKNPWSKEHFNLTQQAKILKENPELAKQLMELANK